MVTFDIAAALLAGLSGAIGMAMLMQLASATGLTKGPNRALVQGAMFTDDPAKAQMIGIITHGIIMGTAVFGTVYGWLFVAFDSSNWWVGTSIGLVHGIIAGLFMGMMSRTHPRMESAAAFTGDATVVRRGGDLRIRAPGFFAKEWGTATPVGIVAAHALYGTIVAIVYTALTGGVLP